MKVRVVIVKGIKVKGMRFKDVWVEDKRLKGIKVKCMRMDSVREKGRFKK